MALTLRRIPLDTSPAFAHLQDWQVLDDGKPVGRLYQAHTAAPPELIWHWSITEYVEPRSGLRTSGTAETLDAAKSAFKDTWEAWRSWAAKTGFDSSSG
jgi:hypothetical protein